jgi:hypothetical protein
MNESTRGPAQCKVRRLPERIAGPDQHAQRDEGTQGGEGVGGARYAVLALSGRASSPRTGAAARVMRRYCGRVRTCTGYGLRTLPWPANCSKPVSAADSPPISARDVGTRAAVGNVHVQGNTSRPQAPQAAQADPLGWRLSLPASLSSARLSPGQSAKGPFSFFFFLSACYASCCALRALRPWKGGRSAWVGTRSCRPPPRGPMASDCSIQSAISNTPVVDSTHGARNTGRRFHLPPPLTPHIPSAHAHGHPRGQETASGLMEG